MESRGKHILFLIGECEDKFLLDFGEFGESYREFLRNINHSAPESLDEGVQASGMVVVAWNVRAAEICT